MGCTAVSWAPAAPKGSLVSSQPPGQPVRRLVSAGCDSCVRVWTYNEQLRQWRQDGVALTGHSGARLTPCWRHRAVPGRRARLPRCCHAGQRQLAFPACPAGQLSFLLAPPWRRSADWVRDVAWAPNLGLPMSTIASAGQDGKVYVWTERSEGGYPRVSHCWQLVVL